MCGANPSWPNDSRETLGGFCRVGLVYQSVPGLSQNEHSPIWVRRKRLNISRSYICAPTWVRLIHVKQSQRCAMGRDPTSVGAAMFAAAMGDIVSRETLDRLALYEGLLKSWQARVNLIGPSTVEHIWHRHFLDSAQIIPLLPPKTHTLVDIGSGAGFPGLVLAILGVPDVHLVDSDQKKAVFLREAARLTETPVSIHAVRAESLADFSADVVTARAVAALPKLLELAQMLLKPGGTCLLHRGRSNEQELTATREIWHMNVDSFRSRTDDSAAILRIGALSRARPRDRDDPC